MEQKIKQDQIIGGNIRRMRMQAGMTQEQMAAKLQLLGIDMSRDFYAHVESGAYNIRVSELAAIRRILRCSYDDFFRGIE